jgi:hypothetical protein
MTRISCLLGAVLCCLTAAAGPTNAPAKTKTQPLPPGDRFLFVVDTSSGMSRVAQSSRQVVFDLIWSGLQGHLRPGDTYGVWTFNEVVYAGRLPMQIWQTNTIELASLAGRFLREQKYEEQSRPGLVVTNLQPVLKRVRDLVVLLISDGRTPVEGTPFDAAINAAYKERAPAARKASQPLVTTLVARGGELVRWSVTQAGEKIELPEHSPPPPPVVAVTNAPPAVTKVPRAPIIITRSHPAESPPAISDTPPVEATPTTPVPVPATATPRQSYDPATMAGSETGAAPPATAPLSSTAFVRTASPSITLRPKDTGVAATRPDLVSVTSSTPAVFKLLSPLPVAARELTSSAEVKSSNAAAVLSAVPALSPSAPFSPLSMLAAGLVLLFGALALTAVFIHRQHHSPKPSIISQSIDQRGRNLH